MSSNSTNRDAFQFGASRHAMMYVLGTTYNLSKRTFLYGTVGYVRNGSNSNFSLEAAPRDSTANRRPALMSG
uniref:Porin domain-containing protein n=1 Tax=Paraburkholderia sprentiae WSM5005 TaxID=754502 RepID=A0A1I9YRK9_9BURK